MRLLVEAGDGYDAYFLADQDDSWAPGKIERAMARLAEQGTVPTLYCAGLDIVDADLRHIAYSRAPRVVGLENALVQNIATGCTSALNASARTLVIGHLPERFLWHDWWYYIVLSALGRVVYDDYPSLKYRQHGGNVIGGATGFYDDFSRRVARFLAWNREGIFGVSAQAEEFGRCFGTLLSGPQRELVRELVDGRKSIPRRVRLAFSSRFVRQTALDTAILRILFLIGRF